VIDTSAQKPFDSEFFLKKRVSRKGQTRYLIQKFWAIWIILGRLGNLLSHGIQAKQKGILRALNRHMAELLHYCELQKNNPRKAVHRSRPVRGY